MIQIIELLLWSILCSVARSQTTQNNLASLADVWPAMINVTADVRLGASALRKGGVDFLKCCRLALNESVEIVDGRLAFVPGQNFLHGNLSVFAAQEKDPCVASYTGYEASVPQGTMSYAFCATHCGGWSKNGATLYGSWIFPITNYILPAMVFCVNIPRRHMFRLPSALLPHFRFPDFLAYIYTLPLIIILSVLEIFIWTVTVVLAAGPMLISGLMESMLDRRVIRFLTSPACSEHLSGQQRSRLAISTVIGHLDVNPAWNEMDKLVALLPENPQSTAGSQGFDLAFILKLLVSSQPEFGPILGVGLIFFLTTFIYSDIEIYSSGGSTVTAHALAQGIFWMVIPHIAIIATSLIAGSNPATWTAVVKSLSTIPKPRQSTSLETPSPPLVKNEFVQPTQPAINTTARKSTLHRISQWAVRAIGSCFKDEPVSMNKQQWMWDRGPCKAAWLARFQWEYPQLYQVIDPLANVSLKDWVLVLIIPTTLVIVVPAFLGAMISYTTPAVGLSCKSLGPLLYCVAQIGLIVLWAIANRNTRRLKYHYSLKLSVLPLYFMLGIFLIMSFASSVILAAFEFAGLTNNCLCYIAIPNWARRWSDPTVVFPLGANTDQKNYYARHYWLQTGIAAVVFLLIMCLFGWLHQKYLRVMFNNAVDEIMKTPEPRKDEDLIVQDKSAWAYSGNQQNGVVRERVLNPHSHTQLE